MLRLIGSDLIYQKLLKTSFIEDLLVLVCIAPGANFTTEKCTSNTASYAVIVRSTGGIDEVHAIRPSE